MKRILAVIALTLTASTLVMGQPGNKKEDVVKPRVEISDAARTLQGWIVEEPVVIIENDDYGLKVYPATTVAIKSISGGSIRFRNEFSGKFVIPKSVSAEESTEILKAIEKAGTSAEKLNAVLQTYRSKSLRYEEFFADPPSMMEIFRNVALDNK